MVLAETELMVHCTVTMVLAQTELMAHCTVTDNGF